MKTLNVSISELEYQKFGLKEEKLAFSDLVDIINKELIRQRLEKSVELAEQYGLSEISMKDLSKEVKDDNKFIELAEESKAQFLVTGNINDFTIKRYKETRIVTPKIYWEKYRPK